MDEWRRRKIWYPFYPMSKLFPTIFGAKKKKVIDFKYVIYVLNKNSLFNLNLGHEVIIILSHMSI